MWRAAQQRLGLGSAPAFRDGPVFLNKAEGKGHAGGFATLFAISLGQQGINVQRARTTAGVGNGRHSLSGGKNCSMASRAWAA